ncbi:hypothetical protein [Bordetella genomosp. 13]|uniref:hypothetical protein n=1 Tax=Bordetella genomosp. 13 TaxID=463040 RepID=UPI00119D8B9F|nr:hypothetical protein [Bordetella genomosp. 13]
MSTLDPKAIRKLLDDQDWDEPASPELLATGLATETRTLTHDEALQWLLTERDKADKSQVVANFLVGVERNHAYLRAALSAYACTTHMPPHPFTEVHPQQYSCNVCAFSRTNEVSFIGLNAFRFGCGAVMSGDVAQSAFLLQEHNASTKLRPGSLDLMLKILDLIRNVPAETKPKDLLKRLRKLPGVKMDEEEGRFFLGLLGHCGILQTAKHPAPFYEYINLGLAPGSSRSSDWEYPVDFWRGSDGVDADAMAYWFGEYPDLLAA